MPTTDASHHDPDDLWANKGQMAAREWKARRYWATLSDDGRAALGLVVMDQLLRLIDRQDEWMPGSVTSNGSQIDITISVLVEEFDATTLRVRLARERDRVAQGNSMMALAKDLRP